jgi:hypothetical protein
MPLRSSQILTAPVPCSTIALSLGHFTACPYLQKPSKTKLHMRRRPCARREPNSLPTSTSPRPLPRTPQPTTPASSPPSPESATPATRSTQVPRAPTPRGRVVPCKHGSCASACRSWGASVRGSSTSTPGPTAWATPGALWTALKRGLQALRRARCCPATRGRVSS